MSRAARQFREGLRDAGNDVIRRRYQDEVAGRELFKLISAEGKSVGREFAKCDRFARV